jgi:hypothetical protein
MTYTETALIQAFGASFFEELEYLDNPYFEVDYQCESVLEVTKLNTKEES